MSSDVKRMAQDCCSGHKPDVNKRPGDTADRCRAGMVMSTQVSIFFLFYCGATARFFYLKSNPENPL